MKATKTSQNKVKRDRPYDHPNILESANKKESNFQETECLKYAIMDVPQNYPQYPTVDQAELQPMMPNQGYYIETGPVFASSGGDVFPAYTYTSDVSLQILRQYWKNLFSGSKSN